MQEVMFEWSDGPNANAEAHYLDVRSLSGEKIEPRMETIKFHKNGKWSYSDKRVFVPAGSVIIQTDQNTHRHRTRRIWIAVENRPEIYRNYGKWADERTWPSVKENDYISQEAFIAILRKFLKNETIEQYDRNASIPRI